jgi:hypothetical protein
MLEILDPETQNYTVVRTVYFMGRLYEVQSDVDFDEIERLSSYAIAGMTVTMSDASGLKYLLTDHLGSVASVTDDQGTWLSQQRYLPLVRCARMSGPSARRISPSPASAR